MAGVEHIRLQDIQLDDQALGRPLPPPVTDSRAGRLRHAEATLDELERTLSTLQRMEDTLRQAHRITDKLFDESGTIRNRNLRIRLEKLEHEVESQFPEISRLVRQCSLRAFLRALKQTRELESLDALETKEAAQHYYNAFLEGTQRLRALIQGGIDTARIRIKEYRQTTPLSRLAPVWLRRGEPGRFLRWQQDNETGTLRDDDRQALETLRAAWKKELSQAEGIHMARTRAQADLRAARVRLQHLFAQGKAEDIRNLITGLQQVPPERDPKPYLALAEGYLAELENRPNDALGHYDAVLQSDRRELWIDALLRVSHWTLQTGDVDSARQTLALLAELDSRYRPAYGDLLAGTGDLPGAIDVYEHHLRDRPDDTHAMSRLAQALLQAGHTDAALVLIEHLAQLPDGASAAAALRQRLESGGHGDRAEA
jgi:predicted negative regulator of RcsB-dependent stress response